MQSNALPRDNQSSIYSIQCLHICKQYEEGPVVFHDATLLVRYGDFVFVTGPNGSGKSTLLRLMFGSESLDFGTVLVGGQNLTDIPRKEIPFFRRHIGWIFQDPKLSLRRSAFENVAMPLEAAGKGSLFIRRKVHRLMGFVGMEEQIGVPCLHLTEAERQRVAVARALANDPMVVLADEPTGNLDPQAAQAILQLLGSIHERGATVILATRNPDLQHAIPNGRTVRIARAAITEDGPWPETGERLNEEASSGEGVRLP